MPLSDTGDRMTDDDFNYRARATDQNGNRVIVISSTEAADDFGWPAVFLAASRKFDAGDFQVVGGVAQVRVLSSDIKV
jgi:hypothetical protein